MNATIPAVVLRSGHHTGLGIARSLGRLGVRVFAVDEDRWEPTFSSRYCAGRYVLNFKNHGANGRLDALLRIGQMVGGRPLLIPTTDREAIWAAHHGQSLREVFRLPEQDPTLISVLSDKNRMQELAQRMGVPTATSVVPRNNQDIADFLERATFPVMLKAIDADRFRAQTGGTKLLIHTRRDLLNACSKALDPQNPSFLIQEFIPGEDWMFEGYFDRDSRCLFGVTAKKIRRFPPQTGVTSLGICSQNEVVHNATTAFMRAIGYRGILDIGYRFDRRDGKFRVLDVNPRIGCTFRLFTAKNGMDVARAAYLDMCGQYVPLSEVMEGRKWLVEDFDLLSALHSWKSGDLKLSGWIGSLRRVRELACFSVDDPVPFLMVGITDCCELYRWIRGRPFMRRRSRPNDLLIRGDAVKEV